MRAYHKTIKNKPTYDIEGKAIPAHAYYWP